MYDLRCWESLNTNSNSTMVVVAPRILLANQLCEEFMQFLKADWVHVYTSTQVKHIMNLVLNQTNLLSSSRTTGQKAVATNIIFTTYHSLRRVVEAVTKHQLDIDVAYFDEVHNSVT